MDKIIYLEHPRNGIVNQLRIRARYNAVQACVRFVVTVHEGDKEALYFPESYVEKYKDELALCIRLDFKDDGIQLPEVKFISAALSKYSLRLF